MEGVARECKGACFAAVWCGMVVPRLGKTRMAGEFELRESLDLPYKLLHGVKPGPTYPPHALEHVTSRSAARFGGRRSMQGK